MPALHLGAEIDRQGRKSREALKKPANKKKIQGLVKALNNLVKKAK